MEGGVLICDIKYRSGDNGYGGADRELDTKLAIILNFLVAIRATNSYWAMD